MLGPVEVTPDQGDEGQCGERETLLQRVVGLLGPGAALQRPLLRLVEATEPREHERESELRTAGQDAWRRA